MGSRRAFKTSENSEVASFSKYAEEILLCQELIVGRSSARPIEIEVYHTSSTHPDPFTHCSKLQKEFGKWYFHKIGNSYRGGSFKGLDITIGGNGTFGAILLRSIKTDDGRVINGPSLIVDYLIESAGYESISELDRAIAGRSVNDPSSPLHLTQSRTRNAKIYSSPRVGLTLKKISRKEKPQDFIMKGYRFLTEPKSVKKGRPYTIIGLLRNGYTTEEIKHLTGSPIGKINEIYQLLQKPAELDDFFGISLGTKELCGLHSAILGPLDI